MNLDRHNPRTNGFRALGTHSFSMAHCFKPFFILVFTCFLGTAMAQRRSHEALTWGGGGGGASNFESGYAVSLGLGVDAPMNYLKDIYKPSITYGVGVMRFMGKFTLSLNASYYNYKPKAAYDQSIILNETGEVTNADGAYPFIFSDYTVWTGYLSAVYNIDIADGARFYGGVNLGGYYTQYAFINFDPNALDPAANLRTKNFYVAPRLGLIFTVADHIGLSLNSSYNFYAPFHKRPGSNGTFFTSVTGMASVIYKF
jgi:hypothetical protein